MNTFWVHKNWKWKKENATAKYIDAQCEEAVTLSDAQATIAALQDTIIQMGGQAAVLAKDAMAAKEQIAALQAERDEYKTMYACLTGETYDNPIADLKAQLTQRTAELEAAKAEAGVICPTGAADNYTPMLITDNGPTSATEAW